MSSVIYSNRHDFFFIIEILLLLLFFFLVFFGLFVCLFLFKCQIQEKPWYFYVHTFLPIFKTFSVDKHSVRGRTWHTKQIYSECVAMAKFIPKRKGCCVHLSSACSSVRV